MSKLLESTCESNYRVVHIKTITHNSFCQMDKKTIPPARGRTFYSRVNLLVRNNGVYVFMVRHNFQLSAKYVYMYIMESHWVEEIGEEPTVNFLTHSLWVPHMVEQLTGQPQVTDSVESLGLFTFSHVNSGFTWDPNRLIALKLFSTVERFRNPLLLRFIPDPPLNMDIGFILVLCICRLKGSGVWC